jgi:transposase InsO family protein
VITYIQANQEERTGGLRLGIELIVKQLQVAPSTYYEAKSRPMSAREERDNELGPQLVALFKKNYSVYGRRKLTRAARKKGFDIGRDQVARLMKREGIRGASRAKKRFTTHADPSAVRAPDLVNRNFTATRPDQLWVADFTYCSTWSGIVYISFITDVFSRRIVGWKASRSMTATLVTDALNMAAWMRRGSSLENLTCHTDAGSQYTSIPYTERLSDFDIDPSIGTVGDSYDNAMAESMFALFKTELFRNPAVLSHYGGHWKGLDDLEIATCAWISWFNEERIHGELGDLTPSEVEAHYTEQSQATAA